MPARILAEARAIRAAFPDTQAMQGVTISPLPPEPTGGAALRAALRYLRDEMVLVRAGKADDLVVLDDEIAGVEHLLTGP